MRKEIRNIYLYDTYIFNHSRTKDNLFSAVKLKELWIFIFSIGLTPNIKAG